MKTTFSKQYPYLAWWLNHQGYMQMGYDGDAYEYALLWLFDQGGTVWQDDESETFEEALAKAEKYVREVDILDKYGKETLEKIKNSI
jgi:hypothetical protein